MYIYIPYLSLSDKIIEFHDKSLKNWATTGVAGSAHSPTIRKTSSSFGLRQVLRWINPNSNEQRTPFGG